VLGCFEVKLLFELADLEYFAFPSPVVDVLREVWPFI
jgi:hypothetical protein